MSGRCHPRPHGRGAVRRGCPPPAGRSRLQSGATSCRGEGFALGGPPDRDGSSGPDHGRAADPVVAALGGYLAIRIQYHGEGLDRLRDRRHAALVDLLVARLRRDGWEVATEVSFNVYGERGSIDILAFE